VLSAPDRSIRSPSRRRSRSLRRWRGLRRGKRFRPLNRDSGPCPWISGPAMPASSRALNGRYRSKPQVNEPKSGRLIALKLIVRTDRPFALRVVAERLTVEKDRHDGRRNSRSYPGGGSEKVASLAGDFDQDHPRQPAFAEGANVIAQGLLHRGWRERVYAQPAHRSPTPPRSAVTKMRWPSRYRTGHRTSFWKDKPNAVRAASGRSVFANSLQQSTLSETQPALQAPIASHYEGMSFSRAGSPRRRAAGRRSGRSGHGHL
jgi:hypothetical protein